MCRVVRLHTATQVLPEESVCLICVGVPGAPWKSTVMGVCDDKTKQYPLFHGATLFNAAVTSACSISGADSKSNLSLQLWKDPQS